MTDSNLNAELSLHYQRVRKANREEELRRLQAVSATCPEIDALRNARVDIIRAGLAKAMNHEAVGDVEAQMLSLNARIAALLKAHGFPENYLDPVYTCPLCRDTGEAGEPIKRRCACAKEQYAAILSKETGEFADGQTFEAYNALVYSDQPMSNGHTQRETMAKIKVLCERFCDELPAPKKRTLLFYGGSGLGKTFMLRCIHARAREKGVPALCVTAYTLLSQLRKAYFSNQDELSRPYFETELLLIDDLGVEPLMEGVTVEQQFNLLNERQNAGLCTVISTNLQKDELRKRYTERFFSRLSDQSNAMMIPFMGEDVRKRAQ